MRAVFSNILGQHTADLLSRITGCVPGSIRVARRASGGGVCGLAVGIDFAGRLTEEERTVTGRVICASGHGGGEVRPLLEAISSHLGLGADILESPEGPQNILNEFLNIVVGLTGADWAAHGFEINFSTPRVLSGLPLPAQGRDDEVFQIEVSALMEGRDAFKVDIAAVFNDKSRSGGLEPLILRRP